MGLLDLVRLSKPGVTSLVVATCATGYFIAPGPATMWGALGTVIGTTLLVASANAINMWMERDRDARMVRTRHRPLAAGRLAPRSALLFAAACATLGTPMLLAVEATSCVLGLIALLVYTCLYTPLKPRSCLALGVGAVPGALPPVMGWTAKTGSIGREAILLFLVLFFWQFVHAGAISVFRAKEYAAAGMKVIAVEQGEVVARAVVTVHAALLVAVTVLAPSFGLGGPIVRAASIVLGAALLTVVLARASDATAWSRRVFAVSNLYLLALLVSLGLTALMT